VIAVSITGGRRPIPEAPMRVGRLRYAHSLRICLATVLGLLAASCGNDGISAPRSTSSVAGADGADVDGEADSVPIPTESFALEDILPNTTVTGKAQSSDAGLPTSTINDDNMIGGTPGSTAATPWMAMVASASSESISCGGVLVDESLVMTAAHCVVHRDKDNNETKRIDRPNAFFVVLGRDKPADTDGEIIGVSKVVMSSEYFADGDSAGDFAYLELARPSVHHPIALLNGLSNDLLDTYTQEGLNVVLAGWGCTKVDHHLTPNEPCRASVPQLEYAINTLQRAASCEADPAIGTDFEASQELCIVDAAGATGTCNGDSGGPVFVQDNGGRWRLLGLVSWGPEGCDPARPSVYAYVPASWDDQWYEVTNE
jgi:secreted trypsin-like serine protease